MQEKLIDKFFTKFYQDNPNPTTELQYTNHFTLLVAVILSARATDKSVNNATKDLFLKYDAPEKILDLGLEGLKSYTNTIGLYNTKSENIIKLCKILIEQHNSAVPNKLESLEALPGVGRKTANVVLNCAFGVPTMPVDTHVFRVARRIGLSDSNNVKEVEQDLWRIIPAKWMTKAHHWLVLHGRYICKSRNPLCEKCCVKDYCRYNLNNESDNDKEESL
ncbi:MAG: endonuclease III [Rickettsiaceae bacterium]